MLCRELFELGLLWTVTNAIPIYPDGNHKIREETLQFIDSFTIRLFVNYIFWQHSLTYVNFAHKSHTYFFLFFSRWDKTDRSPFTSFAKSTKQADIVACCHLQKFLSNYLTQQLIFKNTFIKIRVTLYYICFLSLNWYFLCLYCLWCQNEFY